MTLPVRGQLERSRQLFTGTATTHVGGTGRLTLSSQSDNVTCSGDFVMDRADTGRGVLTCSDKRSGPFEFTSAGRHGKGTGTLDGERFIFTFGP